MSRTGDCYDNAVAESFFATLKAEHVDHEDFPSREVAHASIGDYIEGFYLKDPLVSEAILAR
jgi:putative transposase